MNYILAIFCRNSDIAYKSVSHERKMDPRPGNGRSVVSLVFFAVGIGGDRAGSGTQDGQ